MFLQAVWQMLLIKSKLGFSHILSICDKKNIDLDVDYPLMLCFQGEAQVLCYLFLANSSGL